jgi:hypothetical protein
MFWITKDQQQEGLQGPWRKTKSKIGKGLE